MAAYRRVLLKLSGEALAGQIGQGFDTETIDSFCRQIKAVHDNGVETAIVIGGGNIFRGLKASADGMDRGTADSMGMLATVINGLALTEAFERHGLAANHMSSFAITGLVEPFIQKKANVYLDKGRVVVFSGGTGNPYFSTDSAASLRAAQIHADVILKGTKVDGVYEGDPVINPSVKKFDTISFSEVLRLGLKVMDATSIAMCRDNNIPIVVFNLTKEGTLLRVVNGEKTGTIVKEDEHG
ncbi:MAG: UMP kinase [Candidatus Latescibacteria bacterium]|nr:UMP kinase [Candidatus Latescibacterota bacterium]